MSKSKRKMIDIGWREGEEYSEVDMRWFDYHYRMGLVFKELGYEPSEMQLEVHLDRHRTRLVSGGERAGKSYLMAMDGTARTVYNASQGNGSQLVWIMGPDYEQPRVEFRYMAENLMKLGYGLEGRASMPRGTSAAWNARFVGWGELATKTSSDIKKIASSAPDLILMSEAAQQDMEAYLKARGRVAEKRAPLLMSGTFEGSLGWYAEKYERWKGGLGDSKSFSMPSWSNLRIYPGGREDPEIKALEAETPADVFMERYGAVPFRPPTLIFGEFSYERNVSERVVYDKSKPVMLAVDVGYDPGYYHVSALQIVVEDGKKESVWQVDEVHVQRHTGEQVIRMCKRRVWWKSVVGGVIDLAGRQHQGSKSQVEVWLSVGKVFLKSNPVGVREGIERHRTFLRDPGTGEARLMHNPSNVMTLREYGLYKRPKDQEGQAIKPLPIDRNNHAMKPLAYFLFDRYGPVRRAKRAPDRTVTLEYEVGENY